MMFRGAWLKLFVICNSTNQTSMRGNVCVCFWYYAQFPSEAAAVALSHCMLQLSCSSLSPLSGRVHNIPQSFVSKWDQNPTARSRSHWLCQYVHTDDKKYCYGSCHPSCTHNYCYNFKIEYNKIICIGQLINWTILHMHKDTNWFYGRTDMQVPGIIIQIPEQCLWSELFICRQPHFANQNGQTWSQSNLT